MADDVREIIYTAANFIFLAAVLFVAMLFFNLRGDYARIITESAAGEQRVMDATRYGGYDRKVVNGYSVLGAITSYSGDVPIYVTGAYEPITGDVFVNRVYDKSARVRNPDWFRLSKLADPLMDSESIQSWYRYDTAYYALVCYDSDSPERLAKDMGLTNESGTPNYAGRRLSAGGFYWRESLDTESEADALNALYSSARPGNSAGSQVSGLLFVCLDVRGLTEVVYDGIATY
jgi:hypothetical protein